MNDSDIEQLYAEKYNTNTTSRKDIGDIYVSGIPINIKSSHVDRNNYSPNLISADKLFNHLSNPSNNLKFLFVTYNCPLWPARLGQTAGTSGRRAIVYPDRAAPHLQSGPAALAVRVPPQLRAVCLVRGSIWHRGFEPAA